MARALTPTLLSLDRYASIMGISPVAFNQAQAGNVFPAGGACSDLWWQYSWQASDRVSREDLAQAIAETEQDIAEVIGFYPAPVWIADEPHPYPRYLRREYHGTGLDITGRSKAVDLRWGHFIAAGRRATLLVGVASTDAGGGLTYSDDDGDGFYETATIVLPTTLTSPCGLKLYFVGHDGAATWEIRPTRSITLSGGSVTLVADAWLFIDPALWEAYPTTSGTAAISLDGTVAHYVTQVELRWEYTDFAQPSARFYWENSNHGGLCPNTCDSYGGCPACEMIEQDGCIHARAGAGWTLIVPVPATYDSTTGLWLPSCWSGGREPDQVSVWYQAGDLSGSYRTGQTCEPLSDWYAKMIAEMATARLERPLCSCGNLRSLAEDLQKDLALTNSEGSYNFAFEDLSNPFGTRRGEVKAWRKLNRLLRDIVPSVAVV